MAIPMQTCGNAALPSFLPNLASSYLTPMGWNEPRVYVKEDKLSQLPDLNLKSDFGLRNGLTAAYGSSSPNDTDKDGVMVTEYVPVTSSQHVAEIVGRQGCKIKALRLRTNTYIKTPERWENPVFMIIGRIGDVAKARSEIVNASEHFSKIRAGHIPLSSSLVSCPVPNTRGMAAIQVSLPHCVVELGVGRHGTTVQRLKHFSPTANASTSSTEKQSTYDSSKLELPENRTNIQSQLQNDMNQHIPGSIGYDGCTNKSGGGQFENMTAKPMYQHKAAFNSNEKYTSYLSFNGTPPTSGVSTFLNYTDIPDQLDSPLNFNPSQISRDLDEDRSKFEVSPPSNTNIWGDLSRSVMFTLPETTVSTTSPPLSGKTGSVYATPSGDISMDTASSTSPPITDENSPATSTSSSPGNSIGCTEIPKRRDCLICYNSEIVAALVPCGHNLFCMECANRLLEKSRPVCPVCHQQATQAIRILSW